MNSSPDMYRSALKEAEKLYEEIKSKTSHEVIKDGQTFIKLVWKKDVASGIENISEMIGSLKTFKKGLKKDSPKIEQYERWITKCEELRKELRR